MRFLGLVFLDNKDSSVFVAVVILANEEKAISDSQRA